MGIGQRSRLCRSIVDLGGFEPVQDCIRPAGTASAHKRACRWRSSSRDCQYFLFIPEDSMVAVVGLEPTTYGL